MIAETEEAELVQVKDHEDLLEGIERLLHERSTGHQQNGGYITSKDHAAQDPGVVLCDLRSYGQKAREIVNKIRKNPKMKGLSLFFLTEQDEENDLGGSCDDQVNANVQTRSKRQQFRDLIGEESLLRNKVNAVIDRSASTLTSEQRDQLESMRRAARIQSDLLPRLDLLESKGFFRSSDLILQPKHVVSGDSLWVKQVDDKLLIAVIDCTGHGVPAAMLSMMCHVKLNIAVSHFGLTSPAEILKKVNSLVKSFLGDGVHETLGMDISLCCLERGSKKLVFSGAKRPLTLLRKDSNGFIPKSFGFQRRRPGQGWMLYEWKGTNYGVGSGFCEDFEEYSIKLKQGDRVYMYSDGVVDQFGGPCDKKLLARRFRKLIMETSSMTLKGQSGSIKRFIQDWKMGNEQTDDITLFAFEV